MKAQKGSSELIGVIFSASIIIVVIIISIMLHTYACSNYGSLIERTTKFSFINGCFVKTDSGWIPQEEMSKRAYGNSIIEGTKND